MRGYTLNQGSGNNCSKNNKNKNNKNKNKNKKPLNATVAPTFVPLSRSSLGLLSV